jgi:hypothetical protein
MGSLEVSEGKKNELIELQCLQQIQYWDEVEFIPNGIGAIMGVGSL